MQDSYQRGDNAAPRLRQGGDGLREGRKRSPCPAPAIPAASLQHEPQHKPQEVTGQQGSKRQPKVCPQTHLPTGACPEEPPVGQTGSEEEAEEGYTQGGEGQVDTEAGCLFAVWSHKACREVVKEYQATDDEGDTTHQEAREPYGEDDAPG